MSRAAAAAIARLDLWRYRVPLQGTAPVAERHGALLEWRSADGQTVWSEISPLPGFSAESLDDCLAACRALMASAPGAHDPALVDTLPPAARFGIESGWLQLTEAPQAPPQLEPCRLLAAGPAGSPTQVSSKGCLKLKIGGAALEDEIERIRKLCAELPRSVRLRLDANRSYSPEQAAELCAAIDPERIEFLEEPLHAGASYADWTHYSAVPFAWDETLREHPEADLQTPGLAAVVLKPMLTGLNRTAAWHTAAQRAGCRTVLSGAFESNLSLDFYARLIQDWGLTGYHHGLDTFSAWPVALLEPLQSQAGHAEKPTMGRDELEHLERLL